MPCTPLYPGKPMATGSAEHRALARRAAREGMVLLKNEGALLPFEKGRRLAVFGKAQADYVKGGGGSGDVNTAYVRSIADGMREKEMDCFKPLTEYYESCVGARRAEGIKPGLMKEPELPEDLLRAARAYADTAVVTICRFSGEGYDRTGEPFDGDYFLSREEKDMADRVLAAFPKVCVVLNTGGMMDTLWLKGDARVGAALLAWQGGMEGGAAICDVLCGDACPCGRLTDTFAVDFAAYPSSDGFNESEDYVEYRDDIYVGYRYFETVPGAAEKVCYPFGFGLSYTDFDILDTAMSEADDVVSLTARVKNTGRRAGRQVVQVYCSAPQGLLGKPARVLCGFAKTKTLEPGEAEEISVSFPVYAFASYDDMGRVRKAAYILEKGDYDFYVGANVRDALRADFVYHVKEDRVIVQLETRCAPHALKSRLRADGSYEQMPDNGPSPAIDDRGYPFDGMIPEEWRGTRPLCAWGERANENQRLLDVYEGKMTLADFEAALTDEEKVRLLGGQPNRGAANTFGMGNLPVYGVPNAMTGDGPAGVRLAPETGVATTAFPCATLLACTWDAELIFEVGRAGGEEALENGIGIWLTPAVNIHRSPLCGRNFEYYSEDPLLAGKLAGAMIRGIQSVGVAASMKHFCCNNKETNRRESDSRVSERALREIYLKVFEICVKEADPWTIMSSYNIVNGVRASENRDTLTHILRGEWGFQGLVTTDWYTFAEQWKEINAGNDIKMGCGMPEHSLKMLKEGRLDRKALDESVDRLLKLLLKLD